MAINPVSLPKSAVQKYVKAATNCQRKALHIKIRVICVIHIIRDSAFNPRFCIYFGLNSQPFFQKKNNKPPEIDSMSSQQSAYP
jgi:hypothetical protein